MKTFLLSVLMLVAAAMASAQSDYQVQPGDRLSIEVLEDPQLNRSTLVTPNGTFSFPFAGTVTAAGQTAAQIASSISSGIASNFATTPNVFVSVESVAPREPARSGGGGRTIDIYMLGEVNAPGEKSLERGTTFLQALAQSGGFTRFAATKRVQLRRTNSAGESVVRTVNFRALSQGGSFRDFTLADGDVILVPERRLFE